jgi:hypothetical protein
MTADSKTSRECVTHHYACDCREAQMHALAEATWQVLDDMSNGKQSCCLAAKAMLRRAYEPFLDDPESMDGIMTLDEAVEICRELDI